MSLKKILIMLVLGIVSFGGAFGVGLLTNGPQEAAAATADGTVENSTANSTATAVDTVPANPLARGSSDPQRSMTEKQLKTLIYDIRSRMEELSSRELDVEVREERLKMTMDELNSNIDDLNDLRVKLTSTVTSLQQQKDALEQTIVKISVTEKKNIQKTAVIYDKMQASSAAEIMVNMSTSSQLNYAVKILYYMSERTSAKVLAEIGKNEPALAALISDQLRMIQED